MEAQVIEENTSRIYLNDFKAEKQQQQPSLDGLLSQSECPASRSKRITELSVDMVASDL